MEGAGEVACCSFIFSAERVMLICTLELLFEAVQQAARCRLVCRIL